MQLQSYKILELKDQETNMVVEFIFNDNGHELKTVQTLNCGSDMAYSDIEVIDTDVEYVDVAGMLQVKTERVTRPIAGLKKAYDLTDPVTLDGQIKAYAQAYMIGLEQEKTSKVAISDDVRKLVGVKNTTKML